MTQIIEKLRAAAARAQQDSEYQAATRGLPCAIWLDDGEGQRVAAWTGQPAGPAQRIVVQAPQATWRKVLSPAPPPGYHSFSAALRFAQGFSAKGDALALAQSLHPLERLFEILRGQVDAPAMRIDRRAIQGHYADIALSQGTASLYLETCGAGAPLLMLHTAGADARQYHGLMADPALRARWRMIAFDMPGHGRSAPLPGTAWTAADLRRDDYLAICQAVIRQWVGAPCVLLGCSMGAAMALYLAAHSPGDVAGVVALEAPFKAAGRLSPLLRHPQVNQAAHNPSYVRGLMAPHSPLAMRREAAWIYSQGGFGVYGSDLYFYSEEFDASEHLAGLDTSRFGVSLLTGAYDYSARPEDSQRVAALIPGARYATMPDLGHFPMIEHPARLLDYLRPELQRLEPR
ncbi:hydrolase [Bordetella hinzii]|uniref:alpha/beta fold hydrolase n=1 Tax=Bordetella hinzii TaxID=103855 RepID=UPI0004954E34|nr:alpha/beta hydrolase [Bordetella hinzii]AKQ54001.1 2-hydroxy-6-oxononadienedioate/2-hydroxy-6-oxononatrienedioate hydrolase [Bordetella hinzii]SNV97888.1 hydrolase [Bordetella hinzii]